MNKEDFEFENGFAEPDGWFRRNRSLLKQAFFYFPGVFLLLIYSAGFTYDIFYLGRFPKPLGIYLMTGITILLCIFGLGSLRDPKYIAIPAGVCFVGVLMGVANMITDSLFGKFWFALDDGWSLLFLPFALMAGFVGKWWVDGTTE